MGHRLVVLDISQVSFGELWLRMTTSVDAYVVDVELTVVAVLGEGQRWIYVQLERSAHDGRHRADNDVPG